MVGAAAVKPSYAEARQNMVDNQLRTNKVVDDALIAAMGKVPREAFVPDHLKGIAYVDDDLAIGRDRFLMEPMVLARLIQAAELKPTDRVLDLACATGYAAAVLSSLAGQVIAVEPDQSLADKARGLLSAQGVTNVTVVTGACEAGYPSMGPYDAILIEGTVERLPDVILRQLRHGGRLVTVLAGEGGVGEATLVGDAGRARVALFDAATPRLAAFAAKPSFVF